MQRLASRVDDRLALFDSESVLIEISSNAVPYAPCGIICGDRGYIVLADCAPVVLRALPWMLRPGDVLSIWTGHNRIEKPFARHIDILDYIKSEGAYYV